MHIHFTIEDQDRIECTGPIQVGWFLTDDKAAILYEPPYLVCDRNHKRNMPNQQAVVLQYFS